MVSLMTKPKQSKHPHYDDPSAFYQSFPEIEEIKDGSLRSPLESMRPVRYFKMGKCKVMVAEAHEDQGWFMSIQRNDRYPSWDEMVWLRYRLIPDAARMANILPNLNNYINKEDTNHKYVFTMEQSGWALDPHPVCINCQKPLSIDASRQTINTAPFVCTDCQIETLVNFNLWNEVHGNGATIPKTQDGIQYAIKAMTKGRLRVVGEAQIGSNTYGFDDVKEIQANDSPFNRFDILVLQQLPRSQSYHVFTVPGDAAFKPQAPELDEGQILLATLTVPSRWKNISEIQISYPDGVQA
jgi:hypothetical protein